VSYDVFEVIDLGLIVFLGNIIVTGCGGDRRTASRRHCERSKAIQEARTWIVLSASPPRNDEAKRRN